mgnify:CR=1 FL=1
MATDIRVPTLGESVSEATIGKWFKKPGDAVKADEPLVELETDKVTLEVNAPASGVLSEITVKDGETVVIGGLINDRYERTDKKIPLLGDIPILGYAFKRKQQADANTALLIFLTPHVIRSPDDMSTVTVQERGKLDLSTKAFEKHELERMIGKP